MMDRDEIKVRLNGIVDELASIEHARWSHWQRYLHSKCEPQPDGSLVIPADLAARWKRQVETPYHLLSEQEKQSDRDQVQKYLPAIIAAFGR